LIGSDERPARRQGGGPDDEIMRTSWTPLSPNGCKKYGVNSGNIEVIVHYGHWRHYLVKKFLTTLPSLAFRKFDAHLKLSHGNGSDCHVVLVSDRVIKIGIRSLGID
jgi:hypothetical protein